MFLDKYYLKGGNSQIYANIMASAPVITGLINQAWPVHEFCIIWNPSPAVSNVSGVVLVKSLHLFSIMSRKQWGIKARGGKIPGDKPSYWFPLGSILACLNIFLPLLESSLTNIFKCTATSWMWGCWICLINALTTG